jgi:hypothetical protein
MSQGMERASRWCSVVTAVLLAGPGWSAAPVPHSKVTGHAQPRTAVATHSPPRVGTARMSSALTVHPAALAARGAGKPRVMQISKPRVSGLGGAAAYNARKGAVISGSLVHHR